MADRSVAVRLRAEVGEYKRGLEDAAKAADGLAGKTEAAGKAVDRQAAAADKAAGANKAAAGAAGAAATANEGVAKSSAEAAKQAGYAKDAQGRWRDENGRFVNSQERVRLGLDDTTESSKSATGALGKLAQSARDNQAEWQTLGASFATVGATMGAGLGLATREAIRWESAWAGVQKTTDGSPEQMAKLEGELRQLATTLPSTHEEIAAVAEAAGQLGVAREDISAFTKTAIDLGETTNLSADEAATSLAQLMNVMDTAPEDVGRLGAALVELGNNGASTEAEILNLASYVSGAGQLIGATESDVLALANTMASLGINAERGGGVMSRTLQDIYVATQNGGRQLEDFARVAGMSGAEFTQAFGEDPIRAVGAFTDGLAAAKANGDNVVDILNNLGIKGTQDTAVLLQMAGAQGMLTESLDMGNAAWEANSALVDEANQRYQTTEARLQVARNQFNDAAIDLGVTFLPVLTAAAETVGGLASSFADLPQPVQTAVGGLGAVAAVTATAVGGAMLLIPRLLETRDAFQKLAPAGSRANEVMSGVGRAAKYAGGIAAVAIAVNTLGDALSDDGVALEANALADAVERIGSGDLSKIDEQFRNFEEYIGGTDVDGLASAFERLYDPSGGQAFTDRLDKIAKGIDVLGVTGDTEVQRVTDRFTSLDQTLAQMVDGGEASQAAEGFAAIAAEADKSGVSVEQLNALFPQYQDALLGAKSSQDEAAGSAAALSASLGGASSSVSGAGDAALTLPTSFQGMVDMFGLADEAAEKLKEQFYESGESMLAFAGPLDAYTTLLESKTAADRAQAEATAAATESQEDSWEDYVGVVTVSVDEYLAQLRRQVEDTTNWQTNMLRLAGRVSQGTLDELGRMGPEGAPLVAQLVNASDAELREMETLFATRSENATFAWGEKMRLAGPVLAEIAKTAGEGAANAAAEALGNGTATIEQIASEYGVALASGVNPLLTAVGKKTINVQKQGRQAAGRGLQEADGGVVDYYAQGGTTEEHVAQIAPGGTWRVWAEDETGGEAYIPLHPTKRRRSLAIWEETGRRLGVDTGHDGHDHDDPDHSYEAYRDGGLTRLEQYANGGFSSAGSVPKRPSVKGGPPVSTAAEGVMDKARAEVVAWLEDNLALLYPPATAGGNPYVGGGGNSTIVQIGRFLQGKGARISGHPAWGRVGRHSPTSLHYKGRAIDVNYGGGGANAAENRFVRGILPTLRSMANFKQVYYREIGGRTDHDDHLHLGIANGAVLDQRKGSRDNPHVRDAGGPLLPGWTLNATNGLEDVVPRHAGPAAAVARSGAVNVSPAQVTVFVESAPGTQQWVQQQARVVIETDHRRTATRAAYDVQGV